MPVPKSSFLYDSARVDRFFLRGKYRDTNRPKLWHGRLQSLYLLLDHLLYAISFHAWIFFGMDDDKNETIRGKKKIKHWNWDILWVIATLQEKKIIIKTSKADPATIPYKPCCVFSWPWWLTTFGVPCFPFLWDVVTGFVPLYKFCFPAHGVLVNS